MTLGQLKDLVRFEAKVPDTKSMEGWLDQTIQEEARQITALIKYDELFAPDTVLALTAAVTQVSLPTDLQHLDINSIRFAEGGVLTNQNWLRARRNFTNNNAGRPTFYIRKGTVLLLSPNTSIVSSDTIQINYWKYPISLSTQSDAVDILPEVILPELKMRAIKRAITFIDPKMVPIYAAQQQEKRSASIGQTNLGGMNG